MKQREQLERLLFVSQLRAPGDEAGVRRTVEEGFPREAFRAAGIVGFTLYIGGGYCVFEFGFEDAFDAVFGRVAEDAEIRTYFDRIGRFVDPPPHVRPGATADQPIAADIVMWRVETGFQTREPVRGYHSS
jgi:hypothetical protein